MGRYMSDEALRRAAAKLAEARIAAQPSLDECEHDFSPAFESAMEKLMQKGKRRAVWHRVASIAASLLLVLAIGGGIVLAVSPEVRAAVVTWLREQYENSVIYRFWGGGETSGLPAYRFSWLPEGCDLVEKSIGDEDHYIAIYGFSVENAKFVFEYGTFESMEGIIITDDDANGADRLTVNGMPGEYVPLEDRLGGDLIWIDENQKIAFSISSVLDKDTTIRIAEGITPGRETTELLDFRFGWLPEGCQITVGTRRKDYFNAEFYSFTAQANVEFTYGEGDLPAIGEAAPGSERLTVRGMQSVYVPSGNGNGGTLCWSDGDGPIVFTLSSELDKETTIKIAENILQK